MIYEEFVVGMVSSASLCPNEKIARWKVVENNWGGNERGF